MSQFNIFGGLEENRLPGGIIPGSNSIRDGQLLFYPSFFSEEESRIFFNQLKSGVEWRQESMSLYGKKIAFPRLTAWYGDKDKPYTFSGLTLQPSDWTKDLLKIREKIEPIAGAHFNSVLLNLYRDGNDSISWHTDAEKELGVNPIISSVNFGATRTFQIRHIKTKERIDIPLGNGALLIMRGAMQHHWQHQVPKTAKYVNERINLTFRVLL